MTETYSTYEAKARLSEILRKVESGKTVQISRHGHVIAEVRPVVSGPVALEQRVHELTQRGVLSAASAPRGILKPMSRRPGAVHRFLEDRNG